MPTESTRFMLTVPDDMAKQIEALKKDVFYDKPYAEMFRQLIQFGIDIVDAKKDNGEISA